MNVTEGQQTAAMAKVRAAVDAVGINYSVTFDRVLVMAGGLRDRTKAFSAPGFCDAITGGTGLINRGIVEQNTCAARRVLLAHVVKTLQSEGVTIDGVMKPHRLDTDEVIFLIVDGCRIHLVLEPA